MTDSTRTQSSDARLFTSLIAAREVRGELALLGLSAQQLQGALDRHSIRMRHPSGSNLVDLKTPGQADFAKRLEALLLAYASASVCREDVRCLTSIIANACLRPDHLWRDLGLSRREDVTQMLERFFPELAARNAEGMRWKKFLAQELALSVGEKPGPAPGCPGCEDYTLCFPPLYDC